MGERKIKRVVIDTNVPEGKPYIKNDPDGIFIWCALKGKAHAVISGDSHLLEMKNQPVPVLSAADFLRDYISVEIGPTLSQLKKIKAKQIFDPTSSGLYQITPEDFAAEVNNG